MEQLFLDLFSLSIAASYLIVAVLIVRVLLWRAPKSIYRFLWLLVGLRLMVPFSIESIFSLVPAKTAIQENTYLYHHLNDPQTLQENFLYSNNDLSSLQEKPNFTTNTTVSQKPQQRFLYFASKIWMTGVFLFIVYFIGSWYQLKNKVRTAVPCTYEHIKYYQCDTILAPFLFGLILPKIYIPSHMVTTKTSFENNNHTLLYVLQHELAHRHRGDHLLKPIAYLLLALHWFNPFVWVAYLLFCRDIELSCDEQVIKKLEPLYRAEYSQALLSCCVGRSFTAACPIAFGEIGIKQRIKSVMHYRKPTLWICLVTAITCAVIVLCFMTQKNAQPVLSLKANDLSTILSADSTLTPIETSSVFTLYLPDTLAKKLYFEVVNDLEVIVCTADQTFDIGKLYVMPPNDITTSMTRNEFYFVGNYGANQLLKDYYASFIQKVDVYDGNVPDLTDLEAQTEGIIAIPNADGSILPQLLPNADKNYQTNFLGTNEDLFTALSNDNTLLCYIFIPYGYWNSDKDQELISLQQEFLAYLDNIEVTEVLLSQEDYYNTTNTAFYIGTIEDAIAQTQQEIDIMKKQLADTSEPTQQIAIRKMIQELESRKAVLLSQRKEVE